MDPLAAPGFAASHAEHASKAVKTSATFGVIIEDHFTVCDEHSPKGKLVPIDVEKQC